MNVGIRTLLMRGRIERDPAGRAIRGRGIAIDRTEEQAAKFGGRVVQLAFQRVVLLAHLPGRDGEALDHRLDRLGVLAVERLAGAGQLLAVGLAGLTRALQGARDAVQFLRQALAGVQDLA